MTDPPPPRHHGRIWLLVALGVLVASPAAVATAVLVAGVTFRIGRALWRRRRARRAEPASGAAVTLGADLSGRRVLLPDRALEAHGLILGASGAGKSTTLLAILTEQIRRGAPVVAIDLKGSPRFAQQLRDAAGSNGRRLRVWSLDGPERWNPLADGNPTELKDKLIATERFTEPHYQRAAERYVQTAIRTLQTAEPGQPVTLQRVVALLDHRRLAAAARHLPAGQAEPVRDYVDTLTPDQLSAVRGFAARLAILTESHSAAYLEPGPGAIDLRRALTGGDVVLFSLNSSRYGRLAAQIGTLAVQDLVTASGHRLDAGTAVNATVGIDEFSALASDNVLALLARGREAGISVLLATQELADLDRAGRGLRDQVLGNTAVKIAHRQDVPESAETVARLAGRERVWERSYAVRPGPFGTTDISRGTLRLAERYAVEPDRVRTLRTGEAVVIVKAPRSSTRLARISPPTHINARSGNHTPAPGVTR